MSHTADAAHGHESHPPPRRAAIAGKGMTRRSTGCTRVLVADDHSTFRRGMRAILGMDAETELVGEATDGEEAVELAQELRPDVIMMPLNMPKVSGIEATRQILEASPDTAVLMLTTFEDDDSVFAAMRAGAQGSVLKGADGAATLRAIHAVANGESIFSPTITQRLTEYFATPGGDFATPGGEPKTSSVQASEESAYRTSENTPSRTYGE